MPKAVLKDCADARLWFGAAGFDLLSSRNTKYLNSRRRMCIHQTGEIYGPFWLVSTILSDTNRMKLQQTYQTNCMSNWSYWRKLLSVLRRGKHRIMPEAHFSFCCLELLLGLWGGCSYCGDLLLPRKSGLESSIRGHWYTWWIATSTCALRDGVRGHSTNNPWKPWLNSR